MLNKNMYLFHLKYTYYLLNKKVRFKFHIYQAPKIKIYIKFDIGNENKHNKMCNFTSLFDLIKSEIV